MALLVPAPEATEIDGLRRALADGALGTIQPHLTLVPPVNVREDDLDEAMAVLRSAAAGTGPLELELGPGATFHPETPVVYLTVGGDVEALLGLRDAAFVAPLSRPLSRPFVPHVTVANDFPPERIVEAARSLAGYEVTVRVDRLHLLEEHRDDDARVWRPLADVPLGGPTVASRGPL